MAVRRDQEKKHDDTLRATDGDDGRIIIELKDRIWALENELRQAREAAGSPESAGHRQAEDAITADLKDTQLLRDLGARLVSEGDVKVLYQEIMDTAMSIMHSGCASMQMFLPERGQKGELHLLACRGFTPEAEKFWEWACIDSQSTCGIALRTGQRVITPDVEKCELMAGSQDQAMYLRTGIRAVQTTPLFSRTGRLVGMISTHWGQPYRPTERELRFMDLLARQAADLIERRQAEEALRQSEEKYRELIENANSIILRWDVNGHITFFNEYAQQFFGYSPDEIIGKDVNILVPPVETTGRDVSTLIEDIKRYPHRFTKNVNENVRKNGERAWISWTNKSIYDKQGNLAGIMAIGNDITERRQAEENVIKARDYYLQLFEDFPTPIWRSDTAGKCNYLNRSWYEFTGRTPEQEMGDGWMDQVHPDDALWIKAEFDAAFRERRPFEVEFRLRHRDGSYRSIVDFGKPLFGLDGEFNGFVGSCHDITGRKKAEEALMKAKQHAELYLDLMGHDITNMHQIALGYLELARDIIPEDELKKELLDKPVEVLQRSSRLISNVRKMQKLMDGSLDFQAIDLCVVLDQVRREFGAVPHKPVTLSIDAGKECRVMANALVYDVFSNLAANAIKHTGDRADVSITLENASENDGAFYRVSVADNGPGIPDNFKGVIFNRVLKGTSKAKGMGIGLYLVKSLVDSYGGRVWVEDRVPGDHTKGAKFVVLMPALDG